MARKKKQVARIKNQWGKTFAQADIQNAAKGAETRSIGVKRGLMDIQVWSVFFTLDAIYFADRLSFIHKHAPLLECLLYRRFPLHIHLYPDAGHLNGSICKH
jgi:hypothetical protein